MSELIEHGARGATPWDGRTMHHTVWPPNRNLSDFILSHFPDGQPGFCVDVGASDGMSISTTYAMEIDRRWTVLCVEPNPGFEPWLKTKRSRVEVCACSDSPGSAEFFINLTNPESFSSLRPTTRTDLGGTKDAVWRSVVVAVETIDRLLNKWEFPRLDVLCVDTEGTELDVLRGCDLERWKPRVIVTECWDKVGPIDPYLESFGYKKTARNVHNDIFVMGGV